MTALNASFIYYFIHITLFILNRVNAFTDFNLTRNIQFTDRNLTYEHSALKVSQESNNVGYSETKPEVMLLAAASCLMVVGIMGGFLVIALTRKKAYTDLTKLITNEPLIEYDDDSSVDSDDCEPVFNLERTNGKSANFFGRYKKNNQKKLSVQNTDSMDSIDKKKLIPKGFYEINLNDNEEFSCQKNTATNTNNNNNYLDSYWFPKAQINYV